MSSDPNVVHLVANDLSVIVDSSSGVPAIVYMGESLGDDVLLPSIAIALSRPVPHNSLNHEAPLGVVPEHGSGWPGRPGLGGRRHNGSGWAPRFRVDSQTVDSTSAAYRCIDLVAGLALTIHIGIEAGPVVALHAEVENLADTTYEVDRLAITVPIAAHLTELLTFGGRWCQEFRPRRVTWQHGTHLTENRRGRTSHDHLPLVFAGETGFSETHGNIIGAHLGWSGNHSIYLERLTDGRGYLQANELLMPGEIVLQRGERYRTPTLFVVHGSHGLNSVSRAFHRYIRARDQHPTGPRPVLLNTWEAVYFDHDLKRLRSLADHAAAVGVERFVLDDGWFHGRRNDRAGLGDWWVDRAIYPDGLTPLIDHVHGLAMEFGLWFEPEMVNPDSDLYRQHPGWVLATPGYDPVLARNQLVVDLANPDAFAYILAHVDAVLRNNQIEYVKWDMNRDLVDASHLGRAATHAQTLAVYRLFDELRLRHPTVEFESCSSGGGRADFEILRRTVRVWTSDCNDALERQTIQRGFSYLLPPELMGAHIGPTRAHTTGRRHTLAFRAATAMFGHLGLEWNLIDATDQDRADIAEVVELHKRFRPLLHSGTVHRLDHPDPSGMAHGVISVDANEAIFAYAQLTALFASTPAPLRITGLPRERRYMVKPLITGDRFGTKPNSAWMTDGVVLTGRQLAAHGVQLPILGPESAILLHLVAH